MSVNVDTIKSDYPIPVYRFSVSFVGEKKEDEYQFSEVSGLDLECHPIVYVDGLGAKAMPGKFQYFNITLKKGVIRGQSKLYTWITSITHNTVEKKNITISLLNYEDSSSVLSTWTVINAFPIKLSSPTFDATANEVAIESLTLMADDLKIVYTG